MRSLAIQRQAVEHLIALTERDVSDTIIDAAKQAALTIGWLERQSELLRMIDKLRRDNPHLFKAMQQIADVFPGATIDDVRLL